MSHRVAISITPGSIGTRVVIDGVEIEALAVTVRAAVDELSRVTVELLAAEVEITGTVDAFERRATT